MKEVSEWDCWTGLKEILPHFFGIAGVGRATCVIDCGPGWAGIVDRCCVRIAAALDESESFRFESIRQRQGSLRIAWGGRLSAASEAAVRAAVDLAEARSICVCETCGGRGRLRRAGDALLTRCEDHAQGGIVAVRPEMEGVHLTQVTVRGRLRVGVGARYDFDSDAFVEIRDLDALSRKEA